VIADRTAVREQYAYEDHLELRRSIWQPTVDGRDPATEALAAIIAERPVRVLEVGCGTGEFAARLRLALPDSELVATDQSARMVELTSQRGIPARVADVEDLPFEDESFDVVAAMWMLYHVPDLRRGLAELARVLRPGGLLVAATNGDGHVSELRREAGGAPLVTTFSRENGAAALRPHLATVTRLDFETRAVFADHAQAVAYLESSAEDVAWELPWFPGTREYAGAGSVFLARARSAQQVST
jgi:ubiquinone/menaquinone biosynthesis C-methylase UbiE